MSSQPPAKFFVNQGVVTSREDMLNLLRPLLKQTVSYRYLRGRVDTLVVKIEKESIRFIEAVFPDDERLLAILDVTLKKRLGAAWVGGVTGAAQIAPLLDHVQTFRKDPAVTKRPGLSEVIDAATAFVAPKTSHDRWDMVGSALAKTREDRLIWADLFPARDPAAG